MSQVSKASIMLESASSADLCDSSLESGSAEPLKGTSLGAGRVWNELEGAEGSWENRA